jgi:REP element-mobilizing transposase RayT
MARPRKLHFNKTVLLVTSSIEEGLLLPQNPLVIAILKSAMARAQFHFPVIICHFLFESNHVHLIIAVDDPSCVKGFMERFKTESAIAINKLLGRGKRTVWCAGYDSPILLTADDVKDKIVYLYTNPTKDNLAHSIEQYVGFNSYNYIKDNHLEIDCPLISRTQIVPLEKEKYSFQEYRALRDSILSSSLVAHKLEIRPNAWMNCFPEITDPLQINKDIDELIKLEEAKFNELRKQENKSVPSPSKLQSEGFNLNYISNRKGKKTFCISCNKDLRKRFIKSVKYLVEQAKAVYKKWLIGDFSTPYPLGLYPPNLPKQVHLLNALTVL